MIKSVIIWVFWRADFVDWKIQDSQFSNTSMLCFIKLVYLINKMYWCRDLSFYLAFYVSCLLLLICLFSSGQTMVWYVLFQFFVYADNPISFWSSWCFTLHVKCVNCDSVTISELRSVIESFQFNSTVKGKFLMLSIPFHWCI